jgi:hypothetical protein
MYAPVSIKETHAHAQVRRSFCGRELKEEEEEEAHAQVVVSEPPKANHSQLAV